MKHRNLLMHAG